jgi:MFS transporter, PAT family, beta-lactamase induction signal transducer AmpG
LLANTPKLYLESHRGLKRFAFFFLYFGQGTLVGFFFFVVPSWQAINGASTADVGFVLAAAALPWALKIIDGVLIDRFTYLPMGRRRPWIIGAQIMVIICLLFISLSPPEAGDTRMLAVFALIVNVAIGFQDVATDALAVDLVEDTERGTVNGFMVGGQAVGAATSIYLTGSLAIERGIASASALLIAIIVIVLLASVITRERQGDWLLPHTRSRPFVSLSESQTYSVQGLIRTIMPLLLRRESIFLLIAALSIGITGGMFRGAAPIFASEALAWSGDEYTALSGKATLFAGILGLFLLGFLTRYLGPRTAMISSFVISGLLSLGIANNVVSPTVFSALFFGITSAKLLGTIAFAVIAMRLCTPGIEATQYSCYMGAASLGAATGPLLLAPLQLAGGFAAIFLSIAAISMIGVTLIIVSKIPS